MPFSEVECRVLRYLEGRFVAGGAHLAIMPEDIIRDNGIDRSQCIRVVARFKTLGILKHLCDDGTVEITDAVCHYVAELDQSPTLSQCSAPPVNVIKIGQASNVQIQQGAVGSTQTLGCANASYEAQPSNSEAAVTGQVSVTDQTRYLRADRVTDSHMAALAMANGKVVEYQGRQALLRLDTTVQMGGKKSNVVELHFDQTAYQPRAEGDYSAVLGGLPFYEP
jgi:hypothetical protein